MEKITIADYGKPSERWLSFALNGLSELQQLHRDIYSRFLSIYERLVEPGLFVEADSIYHKLFAEGVLAEFKKIESMIFKDAYIHMASITNGKGNESDIVNNLEEGESRQMAYLKQEVERFKNLEDNYHAARKALCNQDKELPNPQATWLRDSFDKDFEREKAIFADRISHLILNK